jgi:hypothetical protein
VCCSTLDSINLSCMGEWCENEENENHCKFEIRDAYLFAVHNVHKCYRKSASSHPKMMMIKICSNANLSFSFTQYAIKKVPTINLISSHVADLYDNYNYEFNLI